ncbi:MAG: YbaB/EbfC family nucleoid-associated protein [Acidobacteria bacterium]|nr:YbaB/EbfC family nucleoid-associated protein [Acidobacteriota bacterium]
MKSLQNLMKQAQKMQEKLQEEMGELRVEATSGGGAVVVTMDGNKKLMALKIQPEVIDPGDAEMLQDLIVAAVNEAVRKVEEALKSQASSLSSLMR